MKRPSAAGWILLALLPALATGQAAKPKAPLKPGDVLITAAVIDGFIAAYKARDAELRRMAADPTPTGRYYAALLKREDMARRRNDFRAGVGPDYQKVQDLQHQAMTDQKITDAQRQQLVTQALTMEQTLDPAKIPLPEVPFDAQKAAQDRLTRVMRAAGHFSEAEWKSVVDVLPQVVVHVASYPDAGVGDIPGLGRDGGLLPDELSAIKARRLDLAKLLALPYKVDAAVAADAAPLPGPQAYEKCIEKEMKPLSDWALAHKTELEAAQRAGNMAALVAYAQRQQQAGLAAQQKCTALLTKP